MRRCKCLMCAWGEGGGGREGGGREEEGRKGGGRRGGEGGWMELGKYFVNRQRAIHMTRLP